jgi:AcrR family transcriptional regulator
MTDRLAGFSLDPRTGAGQRGPPFSFNSDKPAGRLVSPGPFSTGSREKMAKTPPEFSEKEFNKRCAIGRAAASLFDEKGYLETSLKDISTAAKLSKGGIYHYFSNKHEILFFVLDNYMDLLLEGLEEQLKGISDPLAKIEFVMFRHLGLYNRKVPEAKALLIDAHNLPPKYFKAIAAKEKKYAQMVTDILSEYFDGCVPAQKVKAMSYTLFGMCNAIMYWYNAEGPITLEELSRLCCDLFMRGAASYKKEAGSAKPGAPA